MNTTPTCADRISEELERELTALKELWTTYQKDSEACTDEGENLMEHGLCFDLVEAGTFEGQRADYYRYQISYGGPSDEFRFYKNGDIEYWFLDWFDGAAEELKGEDKELLENVASCFGLGEWLEW